MNIDKQVIISVLRKGTRHKLLMFSVIILLVILCSAFLVLIDLGGKRYTFKEQANTNEKEKLSSCAGIVDVVEEEKTYYVACKNGVFVINNGEVVETWPNSYLKISEINSMAKSGDRLFFGNKGVTSLDLNNGDVFKYNEFEREYKLNIGDTRVASDGDYVWVITWGDFYRIDTNTNEVQVLTEKVVGDMTGFDEIVVTPNSVYVLASGILYRQDKDSKQWQKFDESTFGRLVGILSESKSKQFMYTNGMVMFLTTSGATKNRQIDRFWYALDKQPINWKPFNPIMTRIENDYSVKNGYTPSVSLSGYDEETGTAIFYVNQYEDVTYYYANPLTGDVGLARNKYGDSYKYTSPSKEYSSFIYNVINN